MEPVEYVTTVDKKQWLCFDPPEAVKMEYRYKNSDWAYEREYRIHREAGDEYFTFDEGEIACLLFGENISRDVLKTLEQVVGPMGVRLLSIKADTNRSRYYLVPSEEPEKRIYEVGDLLGHLFG